MTVPFSPCGGGAFHGCYSVGDDTLWGVNRRRKGAANALAALKSIRATRPDGGDLTNPRGLSWSAEPTDGQSTDALLGKDACSLVFDASAGTGQDQNADVTAAGGRDKNTFPRMVQRDLARNPGRSRPGRSAS